jgi:hypothetical protein
VGHPTGVQGRATTPHERALRPLGDLQADRHAPLEATADDPAPDLLRHATRFDGHGHGEVLRGRPDDAPRPDAVPRGVGRVRAVVREDKSVLGAVLLDGRGDAGGGAPDEGHVEGHALLESALGTAAGRLRAGGWGREEGE